MELPAGNHARSDIVSGSSTELGDCLDNGDRRRISVHDRPGGVPPLRIVGRLEGEWMNQRKTENELDTDVQAHIGRQLRAGYVDILNQPVPDRFLELLAELDQREADTRSEKGVRQNGSR